MDDLTYQPQSGSIATPQTLPEEVLMLVLDELADRWKAQSNPSHRFGDTHNFVTSGTDHLEDFLACSMVSRSLATRGRFHLFRAITLKGDSTSLPHKLDTLSRLASTNQSIGTYVRSLHLYLQGPGIGDSLEDNQALVHVLDQITHLESLSLVVEGEQQLCWTRLGPRVAGAFLDLVQRNSRSITAMTFVNLGDLPTSLLTSSPYLKRLTLKDISSLSPLTESAPNGAGKGNYEHRPPLRLQSAKLLISDTAMGALTGILPRTMENNHNRNVGYPELEMMEIRALDMVDLEAAWTFVMQASQSLQSLVMTDLTSLLQGLSSLPYFSTVNNGLLDV